MTTRIAERNLDSLVLDMLEWIAKEPRTYRQTMDAWRTSCPRLAVWEEAVDCGLVARGVDRDGRVNVSVTTNGARFLKNSRKRVRA